MVDTLSLKPCMLCDHGHGEEKTCGGPPPLYPPPPEAGAPRPGHPHRGHPPWVTHPGVTHPGVTHTGAPTLGHPPWGTHPGAPTQGHPPWGTHPGAPTLTLLGGGLRCLDTLLLYCLCCSRRLFSSLSSNSSSRSLKWTVLSSLCHLVSWLPESVHLVLWVFD